MTTHSSRRQGLLRVCLVVTAMSLVVGRVAIGAFAVPTAPTGGATVVWSVPGQGWGRPEADAQSAYFLSRDHQLIAVDVSTGAVRWRQPTGGDGNVPAGARLAIAGRVIVVGDYDLVAFDAASGDRRWQFHPEEGYGPGYYLGGASADTVYAGSPSGHVYAVNAVTGALRWSARVSTDSTTVFEPIVHDGHVYAGFTTFSNPPRGGVVAFHATTGMRAWTFLFSATQDRGTWGGGLVAAENVLMAASSTGNLHFVNPGDGTLAATIERTGSGLPEHDVRPLVASGKTLVAGSLSGTVIAYDIPSRRERWRSPGFDHGSVALAMVADDRTVYTPFLDGRVVAFDLASGRERWTSGGPYGLLLWAPALAGYRLYAAGTSALVALNK